MEEEEYIQLQHLLTKYRVFCMKMYGDIKLKSGIRESYRGQIGSIDNLRKKMPIILKREKDYLD
jgi:hypothetical protein